MLNQKNKYSPDVLDCIANLSNDEVFTSPKLANQMLDMVPQELFTNPRTKFLDPCCKSGVFLREIVKRLDRGLADIIPDRQARIDHILHKQVFGIAITELTAQLSRRTVYCSKYACEIKSGDVWISDENDNEHGIHETHSYSISEFTAEDVNDFCINPIQGNVRFNNKIKHDFDKNGTCRFCGASKKSFDESSHAYELIHINETRLEALKNMQWDLIIGNPPYQLSDGSGGSTDAAMPIYHKFIEQSKKMKPRFLVMIIPSKWMIGGRGLDKFREQMVKDDSIKEIHDFENSKECFAGVHLDGGVCYFLRDSQHHGKIDYTYTDVNGAVVKSNRTLQNDKSKFVIRDERIMSILSKTSVDESFSTIVSSTKPYGIRKDLFNSPERYPDADIQEKKYKNSYHIFGVKGLKGGAKRKDAYISKSVVADNDDISKYKIFFTTSYSTNAVIPPDAILAGPDDICTETFLSIGSFATEDERNNCHEYMKTNFFRFLLYYGKGSMQVTKSVFSLIPIQPFNKVWTDEELYKKYGLTQQEIDFIENLTQKGTVDAKED